MRKWLLWTAVILIGSAGYIAWRSFQPEELPGGFAGSNGRIEAVEIDVATKTAGRIENIIANEGDFVEAGQPLARMDTDVLEAQLREANAELSRAQASVTSAEYQITQRESEKASFKSTVAQREAELEAARRSLERIERLATRNAATMEELDQAKASFYSAEAAVNAAKAQVAAADAAIATAKSQVIEAQAAVGAAEAQIERLEVEIDDSTLVSPRDGRVQYRIAEPGEVLNAGGKVVNLVDLSDVYMTFFLPTAEAGRVELGAEARLVLDAAPHLVIPARVSYVADVAQFTPKTVETAEERQKLMFRIKARIDPELLKKHIRSVKTGLPGMAYVRLDSEAEWPAELQIRVPE